LLLLELGGPSIRVATHKSHLHFDLSVLMADHLTGLRISSAYCFPKSLAYFVAKKCALGQKEDTDLGQK
jgi:hypothetical protein